MTSVTFPNGNSYSDDGTTANDMRNGGFRTALLPMIGDTITVANSAITSAAAAVPAAATATNAATTATQQAAIAVAAANTAAGIVQHVQPSEIAGIDPVLDFSFRASTAVPSGVITGSSGKWVTNQAGVLTFVPSGTAPIDFDPVTSALRGLRIEEARTNLILGSDAPSTQAVSVTAQAYTLSFYGTGTVALSGTYSGSEVGTGAFPNQKTLTFTPTAGSLTLTISGTVQYAQLEAGSVATSYIRTVGSTVTRANDVNPITPLTSIPGWNASEFTVYVEAMLPAVTSTANATLIHIDDGTTNNRVEIYRQTDGQIVADSRASASTAFFLSGGSIGAGTLIKAAYAVKPGANALALNGALLGSSTSSVVPGGLTTLRLGAVAGSLNALNGYLRRVTVFPRGLTAPTLQLLTA